jgi:Zn-dependent protease with chaperone function
MSLAVALGLAAIAGSVPFVLGRRLAHHGSPHVLIVVAVTSMASMALASIVILGMIVGSAALPTRSLPTLVERCVGAATQLLRHPIQHWPRIIAAVLLLGITARVAWAVLLTGRAAHRQRTALIGLPSMVMSQGYAVIASDRPLAFTAGALVRHEVFVSQGLIDRVSPEALRGVLAHERAHANGRHGLLHIVGVAIARAFPFFPPMRMAADQLVLGLELAADQRALTELDDPAGLATALIEVAELVKEQPAGTLAASAKGLGTRVRRLTHIAAARPPRMRPLLDVAAALVSIATLVVLLAALPLSAGNLTGTARAEAAHAVCHLPHATD